jgi:hypothetical protein
MQEGTGVCHRSFSPVPLRALRFLHQIFSSLVGPSDVQNLKTRSTPELGSETILRNFFRSRSGFGCQLLAFFILFLEQLCGQAADPSATPHSKDEVVLLSAEATRVDQASKLDGTLNDPLWQSAKPITDFRQREPHEGAPPTERTEVRILYTRHAVYFGIHCYDSEPSRIIATELRRDVSHDLDDHLEILIDSNHDRRDAYVFEINPLGTQSDGLIVEEQGDANGGDFDIGWDGVWTSEARTVADGWTATIEIPFTTLNSSGFKS